MILFDATLNSYCLFLNSYFRYPLFAGFTFAWSGKTGGPWLPVAREKRLINS